MPSTLVSPATTRRLGDRGVALTALSLGYFMVLFDTTALSVALPAIARSLGDGLQGLAWVTDAYTLTFAASLLAGGVVADRRGAASTFRLGLAAFGLLSLLCSVAPSTAALVAGRGLLGVAGGLLLPASFPLVAGLDADPVRRARAVAAWAAISGSALAAGPLLGGMLVATVGWRGVFVVNAPVAVAALLALRGRMPTVPRRATTADGRGQIAVFVTVAALTTALIRGGAVGWTRTEVLSELGLFVVAAAAAVYAESRAASPAVPPRCCARPSSVVRCWEASSPERCSPASSSSRRCNCRATEVSDRRSPEWRSCR